jgi:hypothetical protein
VACRRRPARQDPKHTTARRARGPSETSWGPS